MKTGESATASAFTLRARLLLREPGDVVSNGCVVVAGGRVVYAGRWSPRRADGIVSDLPDSLITPGLINAHTHLHLSHLAGSMPRPRAFAGWLFQMAPRVWRSSASVNRQSVRRGAEACLAAGVTTVGDICARWEAAGEHGRTRLRKVVFLELLGLQPDNVPEAMAKAEEHLRELRGDALLTPAIAPHAPYSTCREFYQGALALAGRLGCPFSTHVAETRAERDFVQDGRGELSTRLRLLARLPGRWRPPGCSPVELLARWGVLGTPAVLVHCNYLSPEDLGLLAGSHCSVVYCPRSSHYFHVRTHPWQELRRQGVVVALGTDSLASNSSLSILDEMRFLARRHPEVSPDELLAMGTLAGAKVLGLSGQAGALHEGYWADLVAWELPLARADEAAEALIWKRPRALQCYVAGRGVWPRPERS